MSIAVIKRLEGLHLEIHPYPANKARVQASLKTLGFKHSVTGRTDLQALHEAVNEVSRKHHTKGGYVVKPLLNQHSNGYESVVVRKGEDRNVYSHSFKAYVREGQVVCPGETDLQAELQSNFDFLKSQLPVGQVRSLLERIILEDMNGTKSVPSIYWIPEDHREQWEELKGELGYALNSYEHRTNLDDPETVRWVLDHALEAIGSEANDLLELMKADGIGVDGADMTASKAALTRRIKKADKLAEKAGLYASMFGTDTLDSVLYVLESAQEHMVQARSILDVETGTAFSL